jgi:hypothetical protein
METLLKRFLAKNKYPKVISSLETMSAEFDNLGVEASSGVSSNAHLMLVLQNLGVSGKENLEKAEHWVNQTDPDITSLIMLTIIYLRSQKMDYMTFRGRYTNLMELSTNVEVNDREMLYRYLRLLAGFVRENLEFELSTDLTTLSEWIETEVDDVVFDTFINKWITQKRINELIMIKWVVGDHAKLDYYLSEYKTIAN